MNRIKQIGHSWVLRSAGTALGRVARNAAPKRRLRARCRPFQRIRPGL